MVEGKTYRNEGGIVSLRKQEQAHPGDVPVLFRRTNILPQFVKVSALADGVIVGSACVKAIGGSENPVEAAREFAAEFRGALR